MKLYVLSDLHNEFHAFDAALHVNVWAPQAEVVVLAGDIDQGVQGLRWARQSFGDKPIVYVAGNHEFYNGYWERTLDAMRQTARELGIHGERLRRDQRHPLSGMHVVDRLRHLR